MSGTLLSANSQLVTRAELQTLSPPASTATWKPIAHADLIQAIDRQLRVREIAIQKEQFALQRHGARLFAVLDLAFEATDEWTAAMGVRTSNDRSMALEIAVGLKVFVCDNLAFSGDLIALRRKHTAKVDLNADISRAVDRYQVHLGTFRGQLVELQGKPLTDDAAKVMIHDAFREELLPIRLFPTVSATYFHPATADVYPRTFWGLHNAFTRTVKQLAPAPAFEATTKLGRFFGLTFTQN